MAHTNESPPPPSPRVQCSAWMVHDPAVWDTAPALPDDRARLQLLCLGCQADLLAGEVCACVTRQTGTPRWRTWLRTALQGVGLVGVAVLLGRGMAWVVQWLTR